MQERNSQFTILLIGGFTVAALLVVLSILLTRGNGLANLCFYLLIGGGAWGLLSPRSAFYLWIIACGYSDLLKRLMVVFGNIRQIDLYYVLGIPPVLFGGIAISTMVGGLTGTTVVRMKDWGRCAAGILLMAASFVIAARETGSLKDGVQGVANGGLYSLLIFVIPVLFSEPEQMNRIFRFCLWTMLPVAAYGIVQQVWGFQNFEINYLRTGLSVEIKQLLAERVRAFSTLNSPTSLASVSAVFMVVACFLAGQRQPAPRDRFRWLGRGVGLFMVLCYAGALVASTGRAALVVVVVGPIAAWCFAKRTRTLAFYGVGVILFVCLVAASPWLLDHLDVAMDWTSSQVNSNTFAGQLTIVGTYSDRLHGFSHVLCNPAAYSLFGKWDGNMDTLTSDLYFHDPISAALLRFGVVPLVLLLMIFCRILMVWHRRLYRLEDRNAARLMAISLSLVASLVILSVLAGNVLTVFPVNAFFWIFAGTAVACSEPFQTVGPSPVRSTGLDIHALAGRTPGSSRFGQRKSSAPAS